MLDQPNTISVREISQLLGCTEPFVRKRVDEGQIKGLHGGKYVISRVRFYKDMGWNSDEEIRHAYRMAGLEVKEKE